MEETRDALLFTIEISEASLAPPNVVKTALEAALQCLKMTMLASPQNYFGILFYGAQGYQSACLPFLPLGNQDSRAVKSLRRLCESETQFNSTLQPASYDLADIFFAAGQQFEKVDHKAHKRIVWLSATDDPCPVPKLADVAETRCRDLVEKGVSITPLFIGERFATEKFWERLSYAPIESLQPSLEPVAPGSVFGSVAASATPKRSVFNCKIYLKGAPVANVKGYNLYTVRKPASAVPIQIEGEDQTVATTKTTLVVVKSGQEVQADECKLGLKVGTEYLGPIDTEQLAQLKFFEEPSIRIIKVIDRDACKFMPHIKHSTFIYPFEGDLSGSTRAFIAIWQALLKRGQYAIASATLRRNSAPFNCLLVPSKARYYNDQPGVQRYPSGLHLVPIPTSDSIRHLGDLPPSDPVNPASVERLQSTAEELVSNLTMNRGYDPLRYNNPAIVWQDEVIQATALSEPMPKKALDNTLPKYKSIQQRAGNEIATLNGLVDGVDFKRPMMGSESASL